MYLAIDARLTGQRRTIMRMLTSLFTLSMKTSLDHVSQKHLAHTLRLNLQFVETPDGGTHSLPDGKQKADGGERLLASRQTVRCSALGILPRLVWLNLQFSQLAPVPNSGCE